MEIEVKRHYKNNAFEGTWRHVDEWFWVEARTDDGLDLFGYVVKTKSGSIENFNMPMRRLDPGEVEEILDEVFRYSETHTPSKLWAPR